MSNTKASALFVALALAAPPAQAQQVDDRCTVSFLNRSVKASADGRFAIPNIPASRGVFKVRVTCEVNGQTVGGQSAFLRPQRNVPTRIGKLDDSGAPGEGGWGAGGGVAHGVRGGR